jgi:hypothetical protein
MELGSAGATRARIVTGRYAQDLDGLSKAFDKVANSIVHFLHLNQQVAGQLKQLGEIFVDEFARGIGQVVANYVLLGETGPAVIRKVLAASLAAVAQEAAVKAVLWTAQGIADLFFNPARAAADFTAAALFAGIAGVSAVAGRVVAGNLFQQSQSSATGSGAGTGASSDTTKALPPIVIGSQRQTVVIHKIVPPPGWAHTAVVSAYNSNDPEINRVLARDRG